MCVYSFGKQLCEVGRQGLVSYVYHCPEYMLSLMQYTFISMCAQIPRNNSAKYFLKQNLNLVPKRMIVLQFQLNITTSSGRYVKAPHSKEKQHMSAFYVIRLSSHTSAQREREREFHIALPDLRPWGGESKLNTLCLLARLLLPSFDSILVVP